MLRGIAPELVSRVKAFALARGVSLMTGAVTLLERGLQITEARAKGAAAVNASGTPASRVEAAQRAARARWAKE